MGVKFWGEIDEDVNEMIDIYSNSFEDTKPEQVLEMITKHVTYKGFSGVKYVDENGGALGFAYGYTSFPGQYYREKIAAQLTDKEIQQWLTDCFELVELAVEPASRKKGIGRLLHDELLQTVNHTTSILTTSIDNVPAIELYRQSGWQVVKEHAVVIPEVPPLLVMGKELRYS
ncbi:GNAT family N-acetyltransferase [Halobacillus ihumii]|uniref:GNAT family N-acetyltransferase n=1 Tax=Halobacillus ihumii TaxID=2686092 RepID=UPI0013D16E9F|nr:GNAT family N-acetyltransferase [Halobacillus ihumii]